MSCDGGGLYRLPLGKTRSRERRTLAKVARDTPEWGLKNEAPARAYSAITTYDCHMVDKWLEV